MPFSSSCDFCFFLFRFSFGVSATRTKSSENSISRNRLICHHRKVSVSRCVPSSSSGDFCFFLFRFSFGVSSTRTKSSERSISQNPLLCLIITSPPGFYETKKVLQQGAYLPPAPVISAFSFFLFLLEFLQPEQNKKKISF